MSFWNRIIETISGVENHSVLYKEKSRDASRYAFLDVEVSVKERRVRDIGALRWDNSVFHSCNKQELVEFLNEVDFLCGHNIINHDVKYLFGKDSHKWELVDTLYVSPLLFPERPYHRLLKDDKLICDQMNNPVNDCKKAYDLLMDEVAAWNALSEEKKTIFATLLNDIVEFKGFLTFVSRFIVAWRPKDAPKEEKEHAVLLVDLVLKRE